jgi:anaphase-promoting complex subunit 2
VSTLVNIFGSPEKFVEQYKRMLAERSVSDINFSLDNEIKNLELLKIKFGENIFQCCDIIIKDVRDSIKLNTSIKNSEISNKNSSEAIYHPEFDLNCLIINKIFWPFKENNLFTLEVENSTFNNSKKNKTKNFDRLLSKLNNRFENYKKIFSNIKLSRNLNFFSNLGYVDLNLTFDNGSFNFRVSPLSALIINLFDESNEGNYDYFTIENISEKINCNLNEVKKKINFWINKGVISEVSNNGDDDIEQTYYIPNKNFKLFDNILNNELIIEEDIFSFEYIENENNLNLENAISSILKNSGLKNFEQLYKNLISSYQVGISEIKLNEILGKMILEQRIVKEGEMFKLIIPNY